MINHYHPDGFLSFKYSTCPDFGSQLLTVCPKSCFAYRDDHQFSPVHWAAKGGHTKIVEMLIQRGARVHATNMGDDTPLHLAAAHGNRDIVLMVS